MAVSAKLFGKGFIAAYNKEIDWDTDSIRVMLLDNTLEPDQDVDDYIDDVSANEVAGTGYTAEGELLAAKTITYTGATNKFMLDNTADTVWTTSTITARYAVIYVDSGTPSTSALIAYVDFGADVSSSAGSFTITWAAAGIVEITLA